MSIDNLHQLVAWRPPYMGADVICNRILLPKTRLFIFGSPKSWKSMTGQHTAFAIASGGDWFGYDTRKCTVFKYQAELPKAIDKERILKYQSASNRWPANLFFKTPEERVKLDTSWGIQALAKDIEEVMARAPSTHVVVIIDPLYKLMAGKITDEYDVKKFQDNVDTLLQKYDISFVIIHHTRKRKESDGGGTSDFGAEEAIGSSYWGNWCDTMIRLKLLNPYTGSNEVEFTFEYARHAQEFLEPFQVQWSRNSLQPTILERGHLHSEEPTIRGLKE